MNNNTFIDFFKNNFKGDRVIWRLLLFLSIISLIAVYGSISMIAMKGGENNTTSFLIKQAFTLIVGIGIAYVIHRINYVVIYKLANILLAVSTLFLLLTFSSAFAVEVNNASRWIQIPGIGIQFQPSEFAKLSLIIFIVKTLSIHQNELDNPKKVLIPILVVASLISCIILISNFSTAFFIMFTTIVLLFLGRIPFKQILTVLGVASLVVILMGILILSAPDTFKRGETWQKRLVSFVPAIAPMASDYNPENEDKKEVDNHQVNLAKIAIAKGGIFGQGSGNSDQKYRLSQAYCDFIYAIIIEDYGLFGGIIIMFLYLILLYRAGRIVRRCDYTFPALLVLGLTFSLVSQAFIHMGVAVNLLPATGQPLPIISHGTTSLLTTSISFGIILGVSRKIDEEKGVETTVEKEN